MASNGVLVGSVCMPADLASWSVCRSLFPGTSISATNYRGYSYVEYTCYDGSWHNGSYSTYSCDIPGPALTETEQIQAINQFLPYALAFLAAIWGGKKVFDLLWGAAFRPRRVSDPE